jgi:hypothetical protein
LPDLFQEEFMADSASNKENQAVVLPGSLTDFAKAIREIISAVRDVGAFFNDGVGLYDKHQARGAARHLNTLSFTPGGSRRHLERIAAGVGTAEDIEAIGRQMAETAGEVEASVRALAVYRETLREKHGMAAANKLDEIIYGPVGKEMLRMSLLDLVDMGRNKNTPPEHIQRTAARALDVIEHLNRQLIEIHDRILPPTVKQ